MSSIERAQILYELGFPIQPVKQTDRDPVQGVCRVAIHKRCAYLPQLHTSTEARLESCVGDCGWGDKCWNHGDVLLALNFQAYTPNQPTYIQPPQPVSNLTVVQPTRTVYVANPAVRHETSSHFFCSFQTPNENDNFWIDLMLYWCVWRIMVWEGCALNELVKKFTQTFKELWVGRKETDMKVLASKQQNVVICLWHFIAIEQKLVSTLGQ